MRAVDMSGAMVTEVSVTLPTLGSRTSRDTSVDNTRCISPSIRAIRWDLALMRSLNRARDLDPGVALDLVAHAHVLVVFHADAALGAGPHFASLILEAA